MLRNRNVKASVLLLLAAAGGAGALLTGCGGATTNASSLRPTVASSPIIYGLQANGAINSTAANPTFFEVSGLASADAKTGILTAATAYTGTVLQAYGSLPTGFSPTGLYIDGSVGTAVAPGTSVIFGAAISNGNNTTQVIPINPTSAVLTSTEVPSFKQPLTFVSSTTGPLANATYRTAPFPLPFTTTGLHSLTASVADTSGNVGTTTFNTVVVAPTDAALYAANITPTGGTATAITAGSTATITNPITGARTQATADAQGVVILFAAPGVQTLTVTPMGGTAVTQQVTLTAGTALIQ